MFYRLELSFHHANLASVLHDTGTARGGRNSIFRTCIAMQEAAVQEDFEPLCPVSGVFLCVGSRACVHDATCLDEATQ